MLRTNTVYMYYAIMLQWWIRVQCPHVSVQIVQNTRTPQVTGFWVTDFDQLHTDIYMYIYIYIYIAIHIVYNAIQNENMI